MLSQFAGQICLGFPHTAVDCSVVVVALLRFVIAAQIDPDEPSAVASCNDLANFASHRVSSLARKRRTQLAHSCGVKARIFRLIEQEWLIGRKSVESAPTDHGK
jgi:hypothetical protein